LSAQQPIQQQWNGVEPIDGQTVLLVGDNNLGFDILMIRYVHAPRSLIERGAKVIAAVPPPLKPLFDCIDGITAISEGHPRFNRWLPLSQLVFKLGTLCIPPVPKFHLPPAQVDAWCAPIRARPPGRLQVGLCWSGDPASAHQRSRDVPLRALAHLLQVPNVDFYGLVAKVREDDREAFDAADVFDVGKKFRSLRDTACLISGLDLVITVDTAVAHLAGSLGVLTWVMLPVGWIGGMWIPGRTDVTAYPSMLGYRQETAGDWSGVVQSVLTSLRAFAASHSSMKERVDG
jgi:hypothetical protein